MKELLIKSITFIGEQIERLGVFIHTHQKQLSIIGKILKTAILLLAIVFIPKVMWLSVAVVSALLSELSLLDLSMQNIVNINIYSLLFVSIMSLFTQTFTTPIDKIFDKSLKLICNAWFFIMLIIICMLGYNSLMNNGAIFENMELLISSKFPQNIALLIFPSTLALYGRSAIRVWKKKDTIETVTFSNLVKGRTYEYVGTLINIENGDTLVHSKSFVPSKDGKAEIHVVTGDLINKKSHGKTSM